ncbi:MFS transporter [Microtetraspora sp. NBRC 13810]|uniref:MFS transporter n=1 Tax=Microtetraspora sp. NBRC 13810 TaxID=3030990 RepID=UPI0024A36372|nr:MFS transporter [Microtetraspora sp. NBRC 13810]GLW11692.1 MFS transporter [Microtetraspora sp. NBRC 13810]
MTTLKAPAPVAPAPVTMSGGLPVLLAGTFITTLDFFIVNVAIPALQHDLHASPSAIQFIVAGFGIALAAGLITGGRLGDLYGRRRLFATGLVVFTVASAACGVAPSAAILVGARVVQGLGAALLMPQVLAIMNTVYTGERRTKAFSAYGMALGLGGVFGQLIGGVLIKMDVAGLGWRSIFLINIPVGVVALALTRRSIPESRAAGARLDLLGTVLVSLGLVAIVLPLIQGPQQGWPEWTWLCLAASVPLLAAFVLYQHRLAVRGGSPLIDLSLFRRRAFSAGMATNLLYSMTTASFFLILALYLQDGRGLSALESGLVFLPLGVGYFAFAAWSGRIAARLGRQVITVGTVVAAAGYAVLAATSLLGASNTVAWVIPGLFVAGAGMGLVMAPLPALVLAGTDPRHAAAASGVLNTAGQAGNAIGVAVIGAVFYGALAGQSVPSPYAHAFALGLSLLAGLCAVVAATVQILPRTAAN